MAKDLVRFEKGLKMETYIDLLRATQKYQNQKRYAMIEDRF